MKLFGNLADSSEITCDSISESFWGDSIGNVKTCFLQQTTVINEPNLKISTDLDGSLFVRALDFFNNKKISFLPIQVDENFPNLLVYYADYCSIEKISKQNFKNLLKLKLLNLDNNKIQDIQGGTFGDLKNLEEISLSKCRTIKFHFWTKVSFIILDSNKIKFLSGEAFRGLAKLNIVYMHFNPCINKEFQGKSRIAQIIEVRCNTKINNLYEIENPLDNKNSVIDNFYKSPRVPQLENDLKVAQLATILLQNKNELFANESKNLKIEKESLQTQIKLIKIQTLESSKKIKLLEENLKNLNEKLQRANDKILSCTQNLNTETNIKNKIEKECKKAIENISTEKIESLLKIEKLENQLGQKDNEINVKNREIKMLKAKVNFYENFKWLESLRNFILESFFYK